jgi:hypothetical protein
MAEYKCPKCGGSDYFMSQRNVVKGMGWAQRGSIKSIPVCRVCDEIMEGAQIGLVNWEDYGEGRSGSGKKNIYPPSMAKNKTYNIWQQIGAFISVILVFLIVVFLVVGV